MNPQIILRKRARAGKAGAGVESRRCPQRLPLIQAKCTLYSSLLRHQPLQEGSEIHFNIFIIFHMQVCLKMGCTPNYSHLVGIMIINHSFPIKNGDFPIVFPLKSQHGAQPSPVFKRSFLAVGCGLFHFAMHPQYSVVPSSDGEPPDVFYEDPRMTHRPYPKRKPMLVTNNEKLMDTSGWFFNMESLPCGASIKDTYYGIRIVVSIFSGMPRRHLMHFLLVIISYVLVVLTGALQLELVDTSFFRGLGLLLAVLLSLRAENGVARRQELMEGVLATWICQRDLFFFLLGQSTIWGILGNLNIIYIYIILYNVLNVDIMF